MSSFASIGSCQELAEGHIAEAILSREEVRALLSHLASIAQPGHGAPRVLLLLARVATSECDWLEGALQVRIEGDRRATSIESFAQIGAGLRERVVPRAVFPVPVGEFLDAIARFPHLIAPLAVVDASGSHVVLEAREAERQLLDSDIPEEDRRESSEPPAEALAPSDLPTVTAPQGRIPPPPRLPLPGVLPTSAAAPIAPPPARPAIAVAVARIAKGRTALRRPIEDEKRPEGARRHPGAEPSLTPPPNPAPNEGAEPPPPRGDDVDKGWE